ncbi:MAG: gfo/Idh/MocA family oxidoreductase [Acidobacteria bacterium]|nr:MAG: gfo/Idh/MocA family oxidoreductase [Acidobacteriota bacterium]
MSGVSESRKIRVAVVGTGEFGRNHARVYRELGGVELVGVYDQSPQRAAAVAKEFQAPVLGSLEELQGHADAVSVAVPTVAHARVGCQLLGMGLDVLVEKPMAVDLTEADALLAAAKKNKRILQVGHVERFNPAVRAVEPILNRPLFFEVHRLGVFTPRSLDVDVIYDLMIHDLDILLALVNDERVRKMRFFQQREYVSLDYTRRDALRVGVKRPGPQPELGFEKLPAPAVEPLHAELEVFVEASRTRHEPPTNGAAGREALALAGRVMASIQEHAARVQPEALAAREITTL